MYLFSELKKSFTYPASECIYKSWHFHKAVADFMEETHFILANIIYFCNRHLGQSVLIQIFNKHILSPTQCSQNRWGNVKQMGKLGALHLYISKKCCYCLLLHSVRTVKINLTFYCSLWSFRVHSKNYFQSWRIKAGISADRWLRMLLSCLHVQTRIIAVSLPAPCFQTLAFLLFTKLFIKQHRKLISLCLFFHKACRI